MVKNQLNSSTTIGKLNCSLNTRLLGQPPCHASSIPHTSGSCRSETQNYTASSTPSVPPYRSPWFQESHLWNSPHRDNGTRFLFFFKDVRAISVVELKITCISSGRLLWKWHPSCSQFQISCPVTEEWK